jgi:tellurite resistance protein
VFLHLLFHGQRREFVRAAIEVVAADEVVDLREQDLLAQACAEVGIGSEDLPAPARDVEDLLEGLAQAFDTPRARRILLLELLVLALIDGDADEREQELVGTISGRLGVAHEELRALTDFAARLVQLRQDGLELLDA